jgi:hypothetical protein
MTKPLHPNVTPLLGFLAITVSITLWLLNPPTSMAALPVAHALGACYSLDLLLLAATLYYWLR